MSEPAASKSVRSPIAPTRRTVAPARRTHAERSAETRARLLDATIESLIEVGYTAMSTTEVVARAGLSRGAQVHHFPRKVDLVEAAVQRLQIKTQEDIDRRVAALSPDADRGEAALDLLWSGFRSPLFFAVLELTVAARTDESLIPGLRALQYEINDMVSRVCIDLYGPGADACKPLLQALDLSLIFMQGLGTTAILSDDAHLAELLDLWKKTLQPLLDHAERELG